MVSGTLPQAGLYAMVEHSFSQVRESYLDLESSNPGVTRQSKVLAAAIRV